MDRALGWLDKLLGRRDERGLVLYEAVVAQAREPHWYLDGAVPDTTDGRFDMVAAVMSVVMLRLETEPAAAGLSAALAERFVDDMDAQLRQGGIGDIVVGKRIGKLMAMLGGRIGAYRDGIEAGTLDEALARNLYRGRPPGPEAVAHVRTGLMTLHERLAALPLAQIEAGALR
jgi:cytochrome b pre-mRNA-processing protein 3